MTVEREGDNRASVYEENGLLIFRASAAGNCLKNLIAIKMGVQGAEAPDHILKAYQEGVDNEPVILADLVRNHGWTLDEDGGQDELELRIGSNIVIRCHIDGRGTHTEHGRRVIEAKAFAESTFKKWQAKGFDAFPYYATQLSIYMEATGLPGLFAVGLKDKEDRECKEVFTTLVDEPPVSLTAIKARLMRVAAARELPEKCDFEQYPCSTWFLHEDKEEPEVVKLTGRDMVKLNGACETYLRGHNQQTAGKKIKEDAAKEIKELVHRLEKVGVPLQSDIFEMVYVEEDVPGGTFDRKPYTKSFPRIKDIRGRK